jgi:hypothetical protein
MAVEDGEQRLLVGVSHASIVLLKGLTPPVGTPLQSLERG